MRTKKPRSKNYNEKCDICKCRDCAKVCEEHKCINCSTQDYSKQVTACEKYKTGRLPIELDLDYVTAKNKEVAESIVSMVLDSETFKKKIQSMLKEELSKKKKLPKDSITG